MEYNEDNFLAISGLQHFVFCRRQWALIHIEQQWAENYRTADGRILHKNAHKSNYRESRGDCIVTRGMKVHSATLGLSGECDVLEFHRSENGIPINGKDGKWQPYPVEYKRGEPAAHTEADEIQLGAQAMCLEEMLCCDIPEGALYYGQTRHRVKVNIGAELRDRVRSSAHEMHELYSRGYTPKGRRTKACNACSLNELCLPKLGKIQPASEYIKQHVWETE